METTNESAINNASVEQKLPFKKFRVKRKKWETPYAGYLFLSPWLIGLFLLTLYPMIQSVYFSFTDYSLLEAPNWVGLENYKTIFLEDKLFYKSLTITIIFVVIAVPLKLIFALLIAMVLNQRIKGLSIYRTMIYLPSLIGTSVAVAILWTNIFGKDGLINGVLALFGLTGMNWIGSPDTALGTIIVLVVWQFGSSMVIFLAGLKQISAELYEASAIDGASKVKQFFNITLPMLSPVILFNLVLQTIQGFQIFTQAFVITKGGPIQSTYMFTLYLYEKAFAGFEMGYASALAWILLIIIGVFTAIIFISSKYWVFYQEGGK
ncbi:multiple sugar transport system permease protein [Neobacillus niacini]|uniref:carbohydrate ABC transporter permease n=1 Tax=Neobacillus niacini TaxID=86668 RepID=UPI00285CBF52|nr:sugar ABC transporter permease [Neobacillus niacini]MDR7078697.1 multiple sugar transport system permease protein [Neobacillus niacini]